MAADAYGSIAEAVDELLESTKKNDLAKQDRVVAWLSSRGTSAIDPLVHGAVDAVTEWPEGDAFDELLVK